MTVFEDSFNFLSFLTDYWAICVYVIVIFLASIVLSLIFLFMDISKKNVGSSSGTAYFYPGAFDPAHPFANSAPAPKADKKDGDEVLEHHRFPTLSAYDDAHPAFEQIERDPSLTLESLCDDFRDFCASERGLYYSKRDIRTFISALSASHTMILQGMSGTGKTSLPVAFGVYIGSSTDVVPVQPTWKERSDVLGYYNEFTGAYSESELLKALYSAGGTDAVKLIVLDEANIARVEYYFAEFLSLLELPDPSRRRVPAAPSGMAGDPRRMDGGSEQRRLDLRLLRQGLRPRLGHGPRLPRRALRRAEEAGRQIGLASALQDVRRGRGEVQPHRQGSEEGVEDRRLAEGEPRSELRQPYPFADAQVRPGVRRLRRHRRGGPRPPFGEEGVNPVVVRSKAPELLSLLSAVFGEGNAPVCESAVKRYVEG